MTILISPDGKYQWDGKEWHEIPPPPSAPPTVSPAIAPGGRALATPPPPKPKAVGDPYSRGILTLLLFIVAAAVLGLGFFTISGAL